MSIYWDKRRKEEELEAHNNVQEGGKFTRESEKSDCTDVVNIENQS